MTAAVVGAAALAGAFGAGVVVAADGPDGSPPPTAPPVRLVAGLVPADSCGTLLDSYVRRGLEQVGPWGWGASDVIMMEEGSARSDSQSDAESSSGAAAPAPTSTRSTSEDSGTNVQEAGVDEPDTVKTDGEHLFRVDDHVLTTYDVSGGDAVELARLELGAVTGAEILLVGDRLVAVGANAPIRDGDTRVVTVDVSDPARPAVTDARAYDAGLVTARLHDGVVRLVLATPAPSLDFVTPDQGRGDTTARRENEAVVRATTLDDWLPHVIEVGAGSADDAADPADGELLAACDEVSVPTDEESALGTVSVVALDPARPDLRTVTAVASDARTTYFSSDRMYLATSPGWGCGPACDPVTLRPSPSDGTTDLHAFALRGSATEHVASGSVTGTVRDRWAMDSVDGVLRVAVSLVGSSDGGSTSVVTMREDGDRLEEVGRLDDLGRGEQMKAVRWFDDLAVLVTFRQVDPLYAVDLSDVAAPRSLGVLEVPGFSEYLHPLGTDRMIGVGQAADLDGTVRGAQAALLDVHDLTDPRQLDTVEYPAGSLAGAATDPRQFTWLPDDRTALTIVSSGYDASSGWVSVLRLGDGRMDGELVPLAPGTDVSRARTVPLGDGRVVLVAGEDVSFLDL